MKLRSFCFVMPALLASAILTTAGNAQDSETAVSAISSDKVQNLQRIIVQRLQKNTEYLKENIIDLISRETFSIEDHSRLYPEFGKAKQNTISDYLLIPDRVKANEHTGCNFIDVNDLFQLTGFVKEERRILSNAANHNRNFADHKVAYGSGVGALLILFDKKYEDCFDYKLAGLGKIREREVYSLEITQVKGDDIATVPGKTPDELPFLNIVEIKFNGVAWIDAETLEIVRLDRKPFRRYYDFYDVIVPAGREDVVTIQYEYDQIKIKDNFLTLPTAKTVKWFGADKRNKSLLDIILFRKQKEILVLTDQFNFTYSDYKAFEVDTKITFGAPEEPPDNEEKTPETNE